MEYGRSAGTFLEGMRPILVGAEALGKVAAMAFSTEDSLLEILLEV